MFVYVCLYNSHMTKTNPWQVIFHKPRTRVWHEKMCRNCLTFKLRISHSHICTSTPRGKLYTVHQHPGKACTHACQVVVCPYQKHKKNSGTNHNCIWYPWALDRKWICLWSLTNYIQFHTCLKRRHNYMNT